MSNLNFPGQLPTQDPPANAPGDPRVRLPEDRQRLSLQMRMADAYSILATELKKPQPDPVAIVKANGMLMQINAMRPQAPEAQPSGTFLQPQTGLPRPVDRPTDALTGRPLTGQPNPSMR
jgi:hypothetical protein